MWKTWKVVYIASLPYVTVTARGIPKVLVSTIKCSTICLQFEPKQLTTSKSL